MDVKEFYDSIGGNYDTALKQLMNDNFIQKMVEKFLNDPTFQNLSIALDNDDFETAFREAHTLKGVALNFAFKRLSDVSIILTDFLRPENSTSFNPEKAKKIFIDVKVEYENVIQKINEQIKK